MNGLDLCLEVVSRSGQPLRYIPHWISRTFKIEAWFQRTNNRKWHMGYQMISNVGYWCAVVHQVPRSFVVLASVHEHTEFVVDSLRNVQPMKLGMHNPWQATIKLPGVADNTCRSIQHSLQSVCNSLRRPGKNRVAVVDTGRHESVDECCSRHGVKWTPDAMKLT